MELSTKHLRRTDLIGEYLVEKPLEQSRQNSKAKRKKAPVEVPGNTAVKPSRKSKAASSRSRDHKTSVWRDLGALGIKIVIIAIVFVLVFTFLYGFDRNTDPGMAPMVKDGDLTVFYRLDKDYVIGDLLVLKFQGELQVRRVVAKAGDVVDITKDGLIINGALQQEPNIYQKIRRYDDSVSFPLTVGQGQVFVLGDAREDATDSRVYGPVNVDDTHGTVITIVRPRNF